MPGQSHTDAVSAIGQMHFRIKDKINEVLQHLDKNEKRFLIVCCRKGDSIYNYLKPYSINTYHYYMLTDFALSIKDHLEIDVRCL